MNIIIPTPTETTKNAQYVCIYLYYHQPHLRHGSSYPWRPGCLRHMPVSMFG